MDLTSILFTLLAAVYVAQFGLSEAHTSLNKEAVAARFGISELSDATTSEDLQWFETVWNLNDQASERLLVHLISDKLKEPDSFPLNKVSISKFCIRKASSLAGVSTESFIKALTVPARILAEARQFDFIIETFVQHHISIPFILIEKHQFEDFMAALSTSPFRFTFFSLLTSPVLKVQGVELFYSFAIIYDLPEEIFIDILLQRDVNRFIALIILTLNECLNMSSAIRQRTVSKLIRYFEVVHQTPNLVQSLSGQFKTVYETLIHFPEIARSDPTASFCDLGINLASLTPDQSATILFVIEALGMSSSNLHQELSLIIRDGSIPPALVTLIVTISYAERSIGVGVAKQVFSIYNKLSEANQAALRRVKSFNAFLVMYYDITDIIYLGDGQRIEVAATEDLIEAGSPAAFTFESPDSITLGRIGFYLEHCTFASVAAVEQFFAEVLRLISVGAFAPNFAIKLIKTETLNLMAQSPIVIDIISQVGLHVRECQDLSEVLDIPNILRLSRMFASMFQGFKVLKLSPGQFEILELLTQKTINVILLAHVFPESHVNVTLDEYVNTRNAFLYWSTHPFLAHQMDEITQPFLRQMLAKDIIPQHSNLLGQCKPKVAAA